MASVIGQADRVEQGGDSFGILGIATTDAPNNITGVTGIVGSPDSVQVWRDRVDALGTFLTAAVSGIVPDLQGNVVARTAFGFLAGTDPIFSQHAGVYGESDQLGVFGNSDSDAGTGVMGRSIGPISFGVRGETVNGVGVQGRSFGGNGEAMGFLSGTDPVFKQHAGVFGRSDQQGVMGLTTADAGTGVFGGTTIKSGSHVIGVRGETHDGVGVQGRSFGAGLAGKFIGDVEVTGDIRLTTGQDCAEDFEVAGAANIEPGTVMVIEEDGALRQSDHEYDKKVAGVVSGAGEYKPAIILGRQHALHNRLPIALLGKVYCKVDAQFSPIEVGDLLTTSETPGHAMKAADPARALGTLIGKALRPLREGQGMIPILVALQ
jgi:hypothetical protein